MCLRRGVHAFVVKLYCVLEASRCVWLGIDGIENRHYSSHEEGEKRHTIEALSNR